MLRGIFVGLVVLLAFLPGSAPASAASSGVCDHPVPGTAGGSWEKRTSAPLFRSESSAAVLDGKIYIAGGLAGKTSFYTEITRSFEVYDPAADSWKELSPLPRALHHVALASAHGHVYLTGGYSALDFVPNTKNTWAYDPATDSWAAIADLPAPRAAHSMATVNDVIYLVGGVTSASTALWSYDPTTDKWDTHHQPMPTAREHLAVAVLDGKLYAVGGETPNSNGSGTETYQRLGALEVYDPAADSWTALAAMPTPRSSITAAALSGLIHVVSGENTQDNCVFVQHEVYDPKTDKWGALADMGSPRHSAVSGVVANRWYTIDGAAKPGFLTITSLSNTVEVFSPTP